MKLRECKIGLPVRVKSVYRSHPLDGFIYRIRELPTNGWDNARIEIDIMLINGSYTIVSSMSRIKLLKRNSHETT